MGFWPFSKKKKKSADPISEFWQWWAESGDSIADALDAGTVQDWVEQISARVHAIDKKLSWELGPGVQSTHHLCVTSEGDRQRRVTCERWLAQAPSSSARWEYYPARQALPGEVQGQALKLAGTEILFADFRFAMDVDETRRLVHLRVTHPSFAKLSEELRGTATFLMLDNVLGEDGVERWLGGIHIDAGPSETADTDVDPNGLRAMLAAWNSADAQIAILEMQTNEGPVILAVDFGVKRLDHLLMDTHCAVIIRIETPTEAGLVEDAEAAELNELEDRLFDSLGNMAIFLGRETGLGERVIHLHCDSTGRVPELIHKWGSQHPHRTIDLAVNHDPEWSVQQDWL
ncbi:MAG: DUF695 domain-containing protein [Polyangiales bacterium]